MTGTLQTAICLDLGGLELRQDGDRHVIEGICVPWDRVTTKVGPVPEVFDRGAFAELLASSARVKLTDYNHARDRVPVGYSHRFEDRRDGLWASFRLNRTPEGESARMNAAEGVYGGLSVGFIPRATDMRGGVRHVTAARLDHVSLVEQPAYIDASILAVRSAMEDFAELRRLVENPPTLDLDTAPTESQTLLMAKLRRRSHN